MTTTVQADTCGDWYWRPHHDIRCALPPGDHDYHNADGVSWPADGDPRRAMTLDEWRAMPKAERHAAWPAKAVTS